MLARITLLKGDITTLDVDVIVNAANSGLMGGGGVDGAIHRAGGALIMEECKKIRAKQGGCKTGEAVITSGGNLKAKYVVHTVGPVWHGGSSGEAQLLINAYSNTLQLAAKHGAKSIAFPNISTGVYGYPKKEAAGIAIKSVKAFIDSNQGLEEVIFICYDEENYSIYNALLLQ